MGCSSSKQHVKCTGGPEGHVVTHKLPKTPFWAIGDHDSTTDSNIHTMSTYLDTATTRSSPGPLWVPEDDPEADNHPGESSPSKLVPPKTGAMDTAEEGAYRLVQEKYLQHSEDHSHSYGCSGLVDACSDHHDNQQSEEQVAEAPSPHINQDNLPSSDCPTDTCLSPCKHPCSAPGWSETSETHMEK